MTVTIKESKKKRTTVDAPKKLIDGVVYRRLSDGYLYIRDGDFATRISLQGGISVWRIDELIRSTFYEVDITITIEE